MFRSLLPTLLLAVSLATVVPGRVLARTTAAPTADGCPGGLVCDHSLGVALSPPFSWHSVPPGHFAPHVLTWFVNPPLGLDYNIRLIVGPDGATRDRNDAHAATAAAGRLVAEYRSIHATQYLVVYGGAPGVLIRGLPGSPGPDAFIILAHGGALYSIIAPGAVLAVDQRQALASLRFIRRVGPFPSANPPTRIGPTSHRRIPGGVFGHGTLTLTAASGLRRGTNAYSLWFRARFQQTWLLSYSVPCAGRSARLVVDIKNPAGRVVDRVLHRRGRAVRIRQMEEIAGLFRLDVRSHCPKWTVTVSGIAP